MTLKAYQSGGTQILFKVISGKPHPRFRQDPSKDRVLNLGIAFRTQDAPIGYFPFYGSNDFDFSGETSFKEMVLARLPINLSSPASPHTLLLQATAEDVEFLGSGNEQLKDTQKLVQNDLLSHAMRCASGVFIDGVMMALGGTAIKSLVQQFTKSKIKQFIFSKSISSAGKSWLKTQANVDADRFLSEVP